MNAWSYTSTPRNMFMAWCLIKHRKCTPLPRQPSSTEAERFGSDPCSLKYSSLPSTLQMKLSSSLCSCVYYKSFACVCCLPQLSHWSLVDQQTVDVNNSFFTQRSMWEAKHPSHDLRDEVARASLMQCAQRHNSQSPSSSSAGGHLPADSQAVRLLQPSPISHPHDRVNHESAQNGRRPVIHVSANKINSTTNKCKRGWRIKFNYGERFFV
jgi:hypothetical protein